MCYGLNLVGLHCSLLLNMLADQHIHERNATMKHQESKNRAHITPVISTLSIALLSLVCSAVGDSETAVMARSEPRGNVSEQKDNALGVSGGPKWTISRPRLFFTPERIERFRRRIEEEKVLRQAWLKLRERADHLLNQQLVSKEHAEGGTGQHGNYGRPSGQVVNMASTLGLAYRMTGEERYAEKLRQALIHYGGLRRWAGDAKRDPPWHSELNTARFCYAYAMGHDCIYDFLSHEDRRAIAQSMINLGILPSLNDWILPDERIHALDSMGHNWWSVCVSMAGLAALSLLGDEPQAQEWAERVSDSFPEWFHYGGNVLQNKTANFDAKGAFYESVSYANYALSEYLLFRLAYSNARPNSKPPDIPLLHKAGDFFSANFGDSSLTATGARTLRLLLANGYEAQEYHWYISRTDPGLDDPVALVCCQTQAKTSAPEDLPTSVCYSDIGWAIMRSSWEDDATMMAVKSGFTWNHAHPDAGSFILFHAGKPLIIDSGNCSYSRPEYSTYYRQSKAHNVILFNGQGQNPEDCTRGDRGVKTPGQLYKSMDLEGFKYVFADATGPTSWKFSRNYRHFMWIDSVILIFDDVRTHEAGKLEWLLHYTNSVDRDGSDLLISNGPAKAIVRPLFPENMTVTEKKGLKDHDPDTQVDYLALSPEHPTRETKFVTAILPIPQNGEGSLPRLELLTGSEAIGVRIHENEMVTDVYLNLRADGRRMHRNSNNVIHGWDTDAYLLAITHPAGTDQSDPDAAMRYFVACGSYLRKNGKVVLDSLSKVYTVFTPGKPQMEVALQGQLMVGVALRTITEPRQIQLNGKAVNATYDKHKKTVTFHLD
jgi:hypothetical protein